MAFDSRLPFFYPPMDKRHTTVRIIIAAMALVAAWGALAQTAYPTSD